MAKISIVDVNQSNKEQTVTVDEGTTLLEAILENNIDLHHNCGGVCACSTCHVIVEQGLENLSEMSDEEEEQLDEAKGLTLNSRLSCQSIIYGDTKVIIPDQSEFGGS